MRYRVLDGFRGFFLVFMVVVHANQPLNAILGKLNHHYFGWVEDAQGFVFLSGLVVGLVYGGILDRRGVAALWRAVFKRCWEIYKYQLGLILLFLVAALTVFPHAEVLAAYRQEPVWFTLGSAALVTASEDMGILPMYIYFFFASPFVLLAIKRDYIAPLVVASLGLWLFAQTGLTKVASESLSAFLLPYGVDLEFSLFFNIFGWQVLFALGLFIGYRLSQGRLDLSWLKEPQWGVAFYIAVFLVFLLGVFDRVVWNDLVSEAFENAFITRERRGVLSEFYVFAFLLDLFAVTWLLVAGPQSRFKLTRLASRTVSVIFNHKALVFLGQHSLQVFAFHMLVVYFIRIALAEHPLSAWAANAVLILCVLSLYIPAWLHARLQKRPKPVAIKAP